MRDLHVKVQNGKAHTHSLREQKQGKKYCLELL